MSAVSSFFYSDTDSTEEASNRTLAFKFNNISDSRPHKWLSHAANEAILFGLTSLLYLFAALEEADWNILSANQEGNDEYIDHTIWNINELSKIVSKG